MLKKDKKAAAPGDMLKKRPKADAADSDEEFSPQRKKLKTKDLEIQGDGEESSEHSDVEIDPAEFAKFCKENPMDDEGSYDSEEDEDYDSEDVQEAGGSEDRDNSDASDEDMG